MPLGLNHTQRIHNRLKSHLGAGATGVAAPINEAHRLAVPLGVQVIERILDGWRVAVVVLGEDEEEPIGGFHALGTLMAVGIMILPSAAARFWVGNIVPLLLTAIVIAFSGSIIGLLLSYYVNLPAGPAIVLTLGGLYVLSMVVGPLGPILTRLRPRWHFER